MRKKRGVVKKARKKRGILTKEEIKEKRLNARKKLGMSGIDHWYYRNEGEDLTPEEERNLSICLAKKMRLRFGYMGWMTPYIDRDGNEIIRRRKR